MSAPAATGDVERLLPFPGSERVINAHLWHVIDAHIHIPRLPLLITQEHHSTRKYQRRDGLREGLPAVHHQSSTGI